MFLPPLLFLDDVKDLRVGLFQSSRKDLIASVVSPTQYLYWQCPPTLCCDSVDIPRHLTPCKGRHVSAIGLLQADDATNAVALHADLEDDIARHTDTCGVWMQISKSSSRGSESRYARVSITRFRMWLVCFAPRVLSACSSAVHPRTISLSSFTQLKSKMMRWLVRQIKLTRLTTVGRRGCC